MSKANKIIAGLGVCAGLGIALAPLSVFADTAAVGTVTDKLQITVGDSITFGLDVDEDGTIETADGDVAPVVQTNGDGTWGGGNNSNLATDTLSKTMKQGQSTDALGTTLLTVFASKAYKIEAVGNSVALESGQTALTMGAYTASASGWQYKPTVTGMSLASGITAGEFNTAPASAATIASRNAATAATGDTLTVVYGAGVANNAPAGTYVGSMVYTVSAL